MRAMMADARAAGQMSYGAARWPAVFGLRSRPAPAAVTYPAARLMA
jgi:hypothetical protein